MSYEIVYDRLFIKSAAGFTPLILSGSNNCYEPRWNGRERRAREWGPIWGKPAMSEEEMLERVKISCEKSWQQHFKRNGKWVNDAGFYRFVRNGVKNALTMEEIMDCSPFSPLQCSVIIHGRDDDFRTPLVELKASIRTSEELVKWIEAAQQRMKACAEDESAYCKMGFLSRDPLKLPAPSTLVGPVVACYGKNYIVKTSTQGISHSPYVWEALVFDSVDAAKAQIPFTFHARLRFCCAEAVLARQNWTCGIQLDSASSSSFVLRLTRSSLRTTHQPEYAKRFPSEKEAQKYIEKMLQPRLPGRAFSIVRLPAKEEVSRS